MKAPSVQPECETPTAEADPGLPEAVPVPSAQPGMACEDAELRSWTAEVFEATQPSAGRRPLFGR